MGNALKPQDKRGLGNIVGNNVRAFRVKARLTQDMLAERVKLGEHAISSLEHGKTIPHLFKLDEIAGALGCCLEQLITPQPKETDNIQRIERILSRLPKEAQSLLIELMEKEVEFYLTRVPEEIVL